MRRWLIPVCLATILGMVGCMGQKAPADESPVVVAPAPQGQDQPPSSTIPPAEQLPLGSCVPASTAVEKPFHIYGGGVQAQEGTPERPWVPHISLLAIETLPGGAMAGGEIRLVRSGEAVVDTSELVISAWLHPAPAMDWQRTHVLVEGVEPIWFAEPSTDLMQLRIPPGKAGDTFRLTLRDVLAQDGTPGDLVVTFCRQAPVQAVLSYEAADGWREVSGYIPADGPLKLRVTFTAEMDREATEQALRDSQNAAVVSSFNWIDERTVEIASGPPLPMMTLNLQGARNVHGQALMGGLPVLYVGDPVHLAAIDVTTGSEQRLIDLPPGIESASISPDSRQILLDAVSYRAGYPSHGRGLRLVVDIASNREEELAHLFWSGRWLPDGGLVGYTMRDGKMVLWRRTAAGAEQLEPLPFPNAFWRDLAPDGRRLAAAVPDDSEEMRDNFYPARIVIQTLQGEGQVVSTDALGFYRPPKDGLTLYDAAWSPDGTLIALTQPGPEDSANLVVVNTETGSVRTVISALPVWAGRAPLSWSPDARHILVGPHLVNVAKGTVESIVPELWTQSYWSPNSEWLLHRDPGSGEVVATHLALGRTLSLGQGLPVGWMPSGEALVVKGWTPAPWGPNI